MVFLAACTGVWADTGTILIKGGSGRIKQAAGTRTNLFSWANRLSGGMKRCLGIVQAVVGKLMDVRA